MLLRLSNIFYKLASSYGVDPLILERELSAGGREFEIVPISKIKPERVWSEEKLAIIVNKIKAGESLPPVILEYDNGKYGITDGIHRVEASKILGFDMIPAMVWKHD